MIELVKEPVYTTVRGVLPRTVEAQLRTELSYLPPDAKYKLRMLEKKLGYKPNLDYTVYKFVPSASGWSFATGLLPRVEDILHSASVDYTVDNRDIHASRGLPGLDLSINPKYELRDYQHRAVDAVKTGQRGLIQHCTGSGKTVEIGAAIAAIDRFPALVVTHTRTLLTQTRERIEEMLGVEVGTLGYKGNAPVRDIKDITVCTTQTVDKMLDGPERTLITHLLHDLQQLHIDEAHHCRAETVQQIVKHAVNAAYRIGWSGTPFREQGDDLEIEGSLGGVLDVYSYTDAIADGNIVPPHVYKFVFDPGYKYSGTTYNDLVKEYIVENEIRNRSVARIAQMLAGRGEKTLVLVNQIGHGKALTDLIEGARFVQGSSPAKYQREVIDGLMHGDHHTVVATPLLDEGVDIPPATAVIFAHPTRSLVRTYQRMGRVLRRSEGKTRAIVVDIQDRVSMLEQQAYRRYALYDREPGFVVKDAGTLSPKGLPWYR